MKIVQVKVTRTYFKEVTINVEVSDSLVGEELTDFLTNDEEVENRLEEGLSEANLDACGEDAYTFFDEQDNNGGHL